MDKKPNSIPKHEQHTEPTEPVEIIIKPAITYARYDKTTSLITSIFQTSDNPQKYLEENEDYKQIPFSNDLSVGENINKFTDEGRLRPVSEQIEMGLITLADDEILENGVIRKLTQIEQIEMDLIPMPADKEIIIDEEGNKSLQAIIDPIDEELQTIESEIKTIEDEALKSLIQSRLNEEI